MFIMNNRAQKKWNQLDVDQSDRLEGDEVLSLAEWVWSSFRPGKSITPQERQAEARKLLNRCDLNHDGSIDREEFSKYYESIASSMFHFHKSRAKKNKAALPVTIHNPLYAGDEEAKQNQIMTVPGPPPIPEP